MGWGTAGMFAAMACIGCARAEDWPGNPWADGAPDRVEDAVGDSAPEGDVEPDEPTDSAADTGSPDAPEAPDVPDSRDGEDAPPPDEGADAVEATDTVDDVEDGGVEAETCGSSICSPAQTCCSGSCVDTSSDTGNCGGCGVRCDPDKSDRCGAGSCRCETDPACGGGSWIACCPPDGCVDTDFNDQHCGECDWECWGGTTCSFGFCSSSGP